MSNPQGVRLPAEWEPQSGVMLTWPRERGEWGDRLGDTNTVFAQIGTAIAAHVARRCDGSGPSSVTGVSMPTRGSLDVSST